MPEGIERRETRRGPVYVARVYDVPSKRRVSRTFATLADARRWRAQQAGLAARGVRLVGTPETLHEAAAAFLEGIHSGAIRSKRGAPYKPSAVRSYEQALRLHLLPLLGGAKLARIQRRDVQQVVDGMLAAGASPSTVRNALNPLQAIYRRALQDGDLASNPYDHLRLPTTQGRRKRIADPVEAERLLAALTADRALWAAAFYTGCRMGELRALAWEHVDLDAGVIRVERAMDATGALIAPKSRAGRRTIPIIEPLRRELVLHHLSSGRRDGLAFGVTATRPFSHSVVTRRAANAWRRAGLEPIGFHEARHTFASFLIAAGVNAKAISSYLGHASIQVTFDVYGHLMPGNEAEAAALLEGYLERAQSAARARRNEGNA